MLVNYKANQIQTPPYPRRFINWSFVIDINVLSKKSISSKILNVVSKEYYLKFSSIYPYCSFDNDFFFP